LISIQTQPDNRSGLIRDKSLATALPGGLRKP
jgi:hypothetical protein